MSYEPSHRRPPRQERWPHATPQEGWPAYQRDDGYQNGDLAQQLQGADRPGWPAAGYRGQPGYQQPAARSEDRGYRGYRQAGAADNSAGIVNGYGTTNGYAPAGHGWAGSVYGGHPSAPDGYPAATGGYPGAADGFDGAADGYYNAPDGYGGVAGGYYDAPDWDGGTGTRDGFPGPADEPDRDEYGGPRPPGPILIAPDTAGEPGWLPDRKQSPGPDRDRSGLIVGAVTGFLAAAVAIGVATLAAAFVRPQASPIIAVGGAFIDRTPPALKNFAVEHFGENDKTILLLGMYVMIAFIAMAIGCLARRRGVTIGVAGIAAFGLFGAFVAITRPESRAADVIPSVIGGLAGVAALLWLDRASAPVAPLRHAYGGRRTR
jgi:hypothetical protein